MGHAWECLGLWDECGMYLQALGQVTNEGEQIANLFRALGVQETVLGEWK